MEFGEYSDKKLHRACEHLQLLNNADEIDNSPYFNDEESYERLIFSIILNGLEACAQKFSDDNDQSEAASYFIALFYKISSNFQSDKKVIRGHGENDNEYAPKIKKYNDVSFRQFADFNLENSEENRSYFFSQLC